MIQPLDDPLKRFEMIARKGQGVASLDELGDAVSDQKLDAGFFPPVGPGLFGSLHEMFPDPAPVFSGEEQHELPVLQKLDPLGQRPLIKAKFGGAAANFRDSQSHQFAAFSMHPLYLKVITLEKAPMFKRLSNCYRLSRAAILSATLLASFRLEAAPGFSLGLAAIEETDERFRPAFWVQGLFAEKWVVQWEAYGRVQKPVTQSTHLLTFSRQFPLFGSLLGRTGLALALESTTISREDGDEGASRETNTNLGLALGIAWQSKSKLFVTAEWSSSLFPAGLAGILLSTARKQSLNLGVGWRFK
ncbi:hypothetical protein DAPPUDRAFT_126383 [Daphnia pulex]|uniref:Uncharacterized protein n=1 Tax=Daphnia pulex TaxID=6669 RepID=E9I7Y8_DAPPU|nr:hypothetical protein DAPPUDRAFT_126383 [Daphnia pulex]|eukprot:EFX59892.1 hypothetical protein DAPPUDRAFT_126383 [Daphnia pulex]